MAVYVGLGPDIGLEAPRSHATRGTYVTEHRFMGAWHNKCHDQQPCGVQLLTLDLCRVGSGWADHPTWFSGLLRSQHLVDQFIRDRRTTGVVGWPVGLVITWSRFHEWLWINRQCRNIRAVH